MRKAPALKDSADHAFARMDVQVLGDEPANYRTYVKIPDEFTRKQEELNLPRTLFTIGEYALFLALADLRSGFLLSCAYVRNPLASVPWRRLTLWASRGRGVSLPVSARQGDPRLLIEYPTAISVGMFFATSALEFLLITVFMDGGWCSCSAWPGTMRPGRLVEENSHLAWACHPTIIAMRSGSRREGPVSWSAFAVCWARLDLVAYVHRGLAGRCWADV